MNFFIFCLLFKFFQKLANILKNKLNNKLHFIKNNNLNFEKIKLYFKFSKN